MRKKVVCTLTSLRSLFASFSSSVSCSTAAPPPLQYQLLMMVRNSAFGFLVVVVVAVLEAAQD